MKYGAVLKDGDEICSSYSSFRLPAKLVPNPVNEIATLSTSESENMSVLVNLRTELF